MPATSPNLAPQASTQLIELGQRIRAQRKALHISAVATAEAAGLSRVTLHRIEKGEASVTIGAYLNVMVALGMTLQNECVINKVDWIPVRISLANYPQLKQLAWQVHGVDTLTPKEACDIYQRNGRHINQAALLEHEQQLIAALQQVFGMADAPL